VIENSHYAYTQEIRSFDNNYYDNQKIEEVKEGLQVVKTWKKRILPKALIPTPN